MSNSTQEITFNQDDGTVRDLIWDGNNVYLCFLTSVSDNDPNTDYNIEVDNVIWPDKA